MYGKPVYWRETHKQPKFVIFDGRVVPFVLLTILRPRWWSISLVLSAMLILWAFERKGISADSILRYLRASFVGYRRTARGLSGERMPVDFSWEQKYHVDAYIRKMSQIQAARSSAASKPKGFLPFLKKTPT